MSNENETDNKQPSVEGSETPSSGEVEASKPVPKKAVKKSAEVKAASEGSSEAAEKPAAPKAPPKAEAPKEEALPPSPGKYGELLIANGFHPTPLGNDNGGLEMMQLKPEELRDACLILRDNPASQFDLLISVSGVDWKTHLEGVYHLYSTKTFDKVVLKATAVEDKLPSVVPVWLTADWHERETYDLYGIVFEGHPNLKRILMPSDWIGFPMRKDYQVLDERLVWNER